MRYYVEINGESSLDIQGLMIQSLPSISKPLMRSKQETIDGRDGDIVTKLGYSAYDKTLKIGLWGNYDINEVIAFFNQEGEIVFSNEPDKYYRFTILNRDDYVSQLDKFRTCTIALHCQPYKYKLDEEAEELENEYVEQEGTSLTFNNTLVAPMNIDLKGNTLQNGTPTPSSPIPINNVSGDNDVVVCGKNLFDKDNANIIEGFINGQTKQITSYNITRSVYIPCRPNTTYTITKTKGIKFIVGTTQNVAFNTYCTNIQSGNDGAATHLTITSGANDKYIIVFYYKSDVDTLTEQEIRNSIMIEQGNQATTYEAYNGTTYNIDLTGTNLFNGTIYNGIINQGGTYISNANRITNADSTTMKTFILKKGTYTLSIENIDACTIVLKNESGSVIQEFADSWKTLPFTFTTTNDGYFYFSAKKNNDAQLTPSDYSPMLNKGESAKPYEAYFGIELNKIGTYQDYIYKDNDKWYLHKEIGKQISADASLWATAGTQYTGTFSAYKTIVDMKTSSIGTDLYCNYFQNQVYDSTTQGITKGINNVYAIIRIANSIANDITTFRNWISTNTPTIYYVLATPTNTEITYASLINQLESIKNAMSKEGTTNVNQVNNDAPFIITASVLSGTDSITLTNEGNTASKPTLTITGSGVVGVYLENIQMFNISLGTNETIIIDTENMEAYYGSQLKNRQVTGDYSNFALQSGTNNLKFTGLVTNVEITNYNRWI